MVDEDGGGGQRWIGNEEVVREIYHNFSILLGVTGCKVSQGNHESSLMS